MDDVVVSDDWLEAELASGSDELLIFDCTVFLRPGPEGALGVESGRGAWEAGHIPGSAFLDISAELSDPDAPLRFTALTGDRLRAAFEARGIDDRSRVVLYDQAWSMWAARVWWLLRSVGFERAVVLDGGLTSWIQSGRDQSTQPAPSPAPGRLTGPDRPEVFVDADQVLAALDDPQTCIVNCLSPDQHAGRDLSYGRPGHLPGALNVFAVSLCDPRTQRYRPLEELDEMFAHTGVAGERIITYCGGGIAACSDALTLVRLGHEQVAVYDGSLSEWVARDLPLVTD